MFGFFRKKQAEESLEPEVTAHTFVEATGGGWDEAPDSMPGDGGKHADYVGRMLEAAQKKALSDNVAIGETFEFVITDIPMGLGHPLEISIGVMTRAGKYGLVWESNYDETFKFRRVS